jgi:hypothetical protein
MMREGQLELARMEIERLEDTGSPVPLWLYTSMSHHLVQANDYEALSALLHRLHDKRIDPPRKTFSYLLDMAAQAGNLAVTQWIWAHHVDPMFITPSKECCIRMIELATEEGQLSLASRALLVLSTVDSKAAQQAEEMIETAYEAAGRLWVRPHPSKSIHAIFANHPGAFLDPKEALDTPPIARFLKPSYQDRKTFISEKLSKDNRKGSLD